MKETRDRYEGFLFEFEKQINGLIQHSNYKFNYEFSEQDEKIKLKVYISHLHKFAIEIVNKYFGDKYIISCGDKNNKDLVCINIL